MKKQSKPAVNPQHVALFALACGAAQGMAQACEKLARAVVGKGRGVEAYKKAVTELGALETASNDGNKHTVRRYAAEAAAILAKVGRKATIPTVARDRTEKAQEARKSLGIKPRGKKNAKKTKADKPAKASTANAQDIVRAMLRLAAGRASLISYAKAEGYDMILSPRAASGIEVVTPKSTKADKTLAASVKGALKKQAKANGASQTSTH